MLKALPYHEKVKDHFRKQPKTWEYFSISKNKEEQLEQFKTALLKNTYKFDPTVDVTIYDIDRAASSGQHFALPYWLRTSPFRTIHIRGGQ